MNQKAHFFSHDKTFYRSLFSMLVVVALQNLISYSVNMADNIMLGAYSQQALSGAALVNQIFFIVQQTSIAVGDSLIVLGDEAGLALLPAELFESNMKTIMEMAARQGEEWLSPADDNR